MIANNTVTEVEVPIATYQGSSYWGTRFGTLHLFTLAQDFPNNLVKGTTVSSKMVIELGGEIISLDKLKKGDNIYAK